MVPSKSQASLITALCHWRRALLGARQKGGAHLGEIAKHEELLASKKDSSLVLHAAEKCLLHLFGCSRSDIKNVSY
jgi:hypothetical protein